ncbi:MAG: primosomal protein N', partial [Pseudomonadales bacterium]|nr:primosomal protein N' [Pseudomonadales bacterium]
QPLVIVGTQMLAKGHHFTALDTVVMLDIDQGLYNPDFRGTEKTLQLMEQVAGRAGRGAQAGQVIVQTHLPDHPIMRAWGERGYHGICGDLLVERQARMLPPYCYMALLRADCSSPERAMGFLQSLQRQLSRHSNPAVQCIGPMPALMERRGGRHRAQLMFKSPHRQPLHALLDTVVAHIGQSKLPAGLRWSIDVDPQESV